METSSLSSHKSLMKGNQKSLTSKVAEMPRAPEGHVSIQFFHKYAKNQK